MAFNERDRAGINHQASRTTNPNSILEQIAGELKTFSGDLALGPVEIISTRDLKVLALGIKVIAAARFTLARIVRGRT